MLWRILATSPSARVSPAALPALTCCWICDWL
jgi:hypothetical protein